jgi:hypothetical protein
VSCPLASLHYPKMPISSESDALISIAGCRYPVCLFALPCSIGKALIPSAGRKVRTIGETGSLYALPTTTPMTPNCSPSILARSLSSQHQILIPQISASMETFLR